MSMRGWTKNTQGETYDMYMHNPDWPDVLLYHHDDGLWTARQWCSYVPSDGGAESAEAILALCEGRATLEAPEALTLEKAAELVEEDPSPAAIWLLARLQEQHKQDEDEKKVQTCEGCGCELTKSLFGLEEHACDCAYLPL